MRNSFLNCALSFIGCKEADGSYRKIIDIYNSMRPLPRGYHLSYNDPWCAAFVSAAAEQAGAKEVVRECSCDEMIRLYKQAGKWQGRGYVPQTADLVFYDWDSSGSADHVGIVVSVTGGMLKAVEGNVSDSVDYRVLPLNASYIRGYATPFSPPCKGGCPEGAGGLAETESPSLPEGRQPPLQGGQVLTLSLPQLSLGSRSNSVRALQHLLIGNGFPCGSFGADGDFGNATANALKSYQKAKSLNPDGICGKQSWSALLL